MRVHRLPLALAVLAVALSGCGGDDASTSAPPPVTAAPVTAPVEPEVDPQDAPAPGVEEEIDAVEDVAVVDGEEVDDEDVGLEEVATEEVDDPPPSHTTRRSARRPGRAGRSPDALDGLVGDGRPTPRPAARRAAPSAAGGETRAFDMEE